MREGNLNYSYVLDADDSISCISNSSLVRRFDNFKLDTSFRNDSKS